VPLTRSLDAHVSPIAPALHNGHAHLTHCDSRLARRVAPEPVVRAITATLKRMRLERGKVTRWRMSGWEGART